MTHANAKNLETSLPEERAANNHESSLLSATQDRQTNELPAIDYKKLFYALKHATQRYLSEYEQHRAISRRITNKKSWREKLSLGEQGGVKRARGVMRQLRAWEDQLKLDSENLKELAGLTVELMQSSSTVFKGYACSNIISGQYKHNDAYRMCHDDMVNGSYVEKVRESTTNTLKSEVFNEAILKELTQDHDAPFMRNQNNYIFTDLRRHLAVAHVLGQISPANQEVMLDEQEPSVVPVRQNNPLDTTRLLDAIQAGVTGYQSKAQLEAKQLLRKSYRNCGILRASTLKALSDKLRDGGSDIEKFALISAVMRTSSKALKAELLDNLFPVTKTERTVSHRRHSGWFCYQQCRTEAVNEDLSVLCDNGTYFMHQRFSCRSGNYDTNKEATLKSMLKSYRSELSAEDQNQFDQITTDYVKQLSKKALLDNIKQSAAAITRSLSSVFSRRQEASSVQHLRTTSFTQ